MDATTESDRRRVAHHAEGYFIEGGKLWKLGGFMWARATAKRECVTKLEAIALARIEHNKLHMHHNIIQNQLLDKMVSPFLNTSITTTILECGRCKNFSATHLHAVLAPITHHRPFKLLIRDYLSEGQPVH